MTRLLVVGFLFVLAGLCEIGGGYLMWGWLREGRPLPWALLGGLVLALYGVVAAWQPIAEFREGLRRLRRRVHRPGPRLGRLRGRLPARPLRPAGGGDLRAGRLGHGRPAEGVGRRASSRPRGRRTLRGRRNRT